MGFGRAAGRACGVRSVAAARRSRLRLTAGVPPPPRVAHASEAEEFLDLAGIAQRCAIEFGDDLAALQDQHPVGKRADEVEILLHQQDRQAPVLAQLQQRLFDLLDDAWLDAFRRFVEQKQPGIGHQPARQREKLLFSAGKRTAFAVEQPADAGEACQHAVERLLLATALAMVVPGEPEVLAHCQLRENAAPLRDIAEPALGTLVRLQPRDVFSVKRDRTAACRQKAHDRLEQCRLAHAVMAENADDLAVIDMKVDAVQHRYAAIGGGK